MYTMTTMAAVERSNQGQGEDADGKSGKDDKEEHGRQRENEEKGKREGDKKKEELIEHTFLAGCFPFGNHPQKTILPVRFPDRNFSFWTIILNTHSLLDGFLLSTFPIC